MGEEKSILDIDLYSLEKEWARQGNLMRSWCKKKARADRMTRDAKDYMEYVKAKLSLQARHQPDRFRITKVTDASVEQAVIIHGTFREAQKAYSLAKEAADMIGATVEGLRNKRDALQDMVKLLLNDYYAEPRIPKGVPAYSTEKLREAGKRPARKGISRDRN